MPRRRRKTCMTDQDANPIEEASWPPEWARSIAFLVGIGLIVWETVIDQGANPWAYGPAFLLTGFPLAKGVETVLNRLPGGK